MFSRQTKTATSPIRETADAQQRRAVAASLIGENVVIDGDLATQGDVQLDGAINGDLRAGLLTVGETGRVAGSIEAEAVDIRGEVRGAVVAKSVRLRATARVYGDITHSQISIEAGAYFVGRSLARDEDAAATPVALLAQDIAAE